MDIERLSISRLKPEKRKHLSLMDGVSGFKAISKSNSISTFPLVFSLFSRKPKPMSKLRHCGEDGVIEIGSSKPWLEIK